MDYATGAMGPSSLHVDAATLRQIEIMTNSRLRSARAR